GWGLGDARAPGRDRPRGDRPRPHRRDRRQRANVAFGRTASARGSTNELVERSRGLAVSVLGSSDVPGLRTDDEGRAIIECPCCGGVATFHGSDEREAYECGACGWWG